MSLVDILKSNDESGLIPGVIVGIVTDTKDPDGIGRIKVQYPLMKVNKVNIESAWIPMATFFAGNKRGAFFLPAINDEVLIVFAYGNVNMPYVIGAVWNGVDVPPVDKAQQQNVATITTRNGNQIVFDDTNKKGSITITDVKKNQIIIDTSNEKITISANKEITISAQNGTVNITAAQDVVLNASGNATIKAKQITLDATQNLTLKGSMININ